MTQTPKLDPEVQTPTLELDLGSLTPDPDPRPQSWVLIQILIRALDPRP